MSILSVHYGLRDFAPPPEDAEADVRFEESLVYSGDELCRDITRGALAYNFFPVAIRLDTELAPQLKRIKARAEKEREKFDDWAKTLGRPAQSKHRVRTTNYRTYLRILDAKSGDVPTSEIAEVLFGKMYSKLSKADREKKVTESFDAACRLRNSSYRQRVIAMTAEK